VKKLNKLSEKGMELDNLLNEKKMSELKLIDDIQKLDEHISEVAKSLMESAKKGISLPGFIASLLVQTKLNELNEAFKLYIAENEAFKLYIAGFLEANPAWKKIKQEETND
jgi:hypothetical protein